MRRDALRKRPPREWTDERGVSYYAYDVFCVYLNGRRIAFGCRAGSEMIARERPGATVTRERWVYRTNKPRP